VSPTVARLSAESTFCHCQQFEHRRDPKLKEEEPSVEDWEMEWRSPVGKYSKLGGATEEATRMTANFGSLVCIADCNYARFKLRPAKAGKKINHRYTGTHEKALGKQLE